MSDGLKAWHEDIEEYQALCSMYLEKPKCTNDINYKHFSELKDRRIKEEILTNASVLIDYLIVVNYHLKNNLKSN
jgi:hypothetical protein